jgi:putative flavoprotein involved in K+ transport
VLDDKGTPLVTGGRQHPAAPGLFFTGYRTELSGQMRLMRFDARSIARALTAEGAAGARKLRQRSMRRK